MVLWKHESRSRTFDPLKTWAKAQKPLVFWKHESRSKTISPLKIWAKTQKSLVLWKHEPKPKKSLVLWKHEPKPKKSLVLWKHETRFRTFGPLKHMTKISIFFCPQVSMFCTHSKKKKIACMNYIWTWSSYQEVCRQSPSKFSLHFNP